MPSFSKAYSGRLKHVQAPTRSGFGGQRAGDLVDMRPAVAATATRCLGIRHPKKVTKVRHNYPIYLLVLGLGSSKLNFVFVIIRGEGYNPYPKVDKMKYFVGWLVGWFLDYSSKR